MQEGLLGVDSGGLGRDGGMSKRTGVCCGADYTIQGCPVGCRLWSGFTAALPLLAWGLLCPLNPVQELPCPFVRQSLVTHCILWAASVLCVYSIRIYSFNACLLSSSWMLGSTPGGK